MSATRMSILVAGALLAGLAVGAVVDPSWGSSIEGSEETSPHESKTSHDADDDSISFSAGSDDGKAVFSLHL